VAHLLPVDELKRFVTVEVAEIFNTFCSELIDDPVVSTGKKMASVVAKISNRDHSAVTRILEQLNDKCERAFSSKLYVQTEIQKKPGYVLLPLGEEFRKFTKGISQGCAMLARIAINTFSFHTLIDIEKRMKAIGGGQRFERKFFNLRSHAIFDAVKHNPNIDAGITESLLPLSTGRQLEVMKLNEYRLVLAVRTPISDECIDPQHNNRITEQALKEIPLLLGTTSNFLDFLIAISEKSRRQRENMMRKLPFAEKESYVRKHFNIHDMSSSVNLLLDVFLLGAEDCSIIVTPEVRAHIMAMNGTAYVQGETRMAELSQKNRYLEAHRQAIHYQHFYRRPV